MRHFVIGTSGHIDHGKSTLVTALTGTDPDRLKEEQARGITIDLGFAHYIDGDIAMSFVDVPGHERFVKNMLAGATGMDAVVLVIAADESVMPQTREHFAIAKLLGVGHGLIVLTKTDLVDDETVALVRLEARELVAGSFLEGAPILDVSARTGAGLDALRVALRSIVGLAPPRSTDGPFRLAVDRVFTVRGFGTVVTGTAISGVVRVDDELESVLQGRIVKVRGLHVHGARTDQAVAGQRVAMNLGGVDVNELSRGDTIASPGAFVATPRFDASIELLGDAKPFKHGTRVRVHQGTSEHLARLSLGRSLVEDSTAGARAEIAPGGRAYVRVRLERPAVLARGDRYVVRTYSPADTVAGGVVLDPLPPRNATRGAAQLERMKRLDVSGVDVHALEAQAAALTVALREAGLRGVFPPALQTRWAIAPSSARRVLSRLIERGEAVAVGEGVVSAGAVSHAEAVILALLERHHRDEPLSSGLPREEVRTRVFGTATPAVFEYVLAQLTKAGRIADGDRVAIASHRVALTGPDAEAMTRVVGQYLDAGLRPPDRAALESLAAVSSTAAERVIQLLVRQKVLVKVDVLYFHVECLEALKRDVRALKTTGSGLVDVATFKERYGITRKFAIPLLEYLDRERVTRRVGEKRVII